MACLFIAYSKPAVLLLSGQTVLCCMLSACVFSLSLHVTEKHPVSLVKPVSSVAVIAVLMQWYHVVLCLMLSLWPSLTEKNLMLSCCFGLIEKAQPGVSGVCGI